MTGNAGLAPPARTFSNLTWDERNTRFLVFGGGADAELDDFWSLTVDYRSLRYDCRQACRMSCTGDGCLVCDDWLRLEPICDESCPGEELPCTVQTCESNSGRCNLTGLEVCNVQQTGFQLLATCETAPACARVLLQCQSDDTCSSVTSCEDLPPTATITSPAAMLNLDYDGFDQTRNFWYVDVPVAGVAIDPEGGALSGSALVWKTDQVTVQEEILGTGEQLVIRLYSDVCQGITHNIRLEATDAAGKTTSSAILTIYASTLC